MSACEACGTVLPERETGRPRKWCDDVCRKGPSTQRLNPREFRARRLRLLAACQGARVQAFAVERMIDRNSTAAASATLDGALLAAAEGR